MKIILASSSPRRREIFTQIGLKGEFVSPKVEEVILNSPLETAVYNAVRKAKWAYQNRKSRKEEVILGFDTIVFIEGKIMGKPKDKIEARKMLKTLSGTWHEVYTGVAALKGETILEDYEVTRVKFHKLNDFQISYYLRKNTNFEKAGSYGIEEENLSFIDVIEGSFSNVVGFPIEVSLNLLREIEVFI
ncbi:MAG: Maf family protein [candidate division WOR-3 bacterium]